MAELIQLPAPRLLETRHDRYRAIGSNQET